MLGKHTHESHLSTPMTVNSSDMKAVARDEGADFNYFSWPPRSYNCNFCQRGFESAQALGGHMNVHRREKAKLTHSLMNSNSRGRHASIPNNLTHSNDQTSINIIRTLVHNPNPKLFVHPSLFGKRQIDGTPSILRERKHSKSIPVIIFSILSADRDEANEKRTTIHRVVQDEGNNVLQSSSTMKLKPFIRSKEDDLSCKKRHRRTQENVQSSDELLMKTRSISRADFDCRLQTAGFSKKATALVVKGDSLDLELRLGHLPQL